MFTGIVEEVGIVKSFEKSFGNSKLTVCCEKVLQDTKVGDSIAVNGVCQTVTELGSNYFVVQVSGETLNVTNFSKLNSNDNVNLERALTLQSRLGGHIVTGHVDNLIKVVEKKQENEFCTLTFDVQKPYSKYIAQKGSVTINGVSLTVADINSDEFSIAVIPHTLNNTTLKSLNIGDYANLEVDILSKYIEKFLSRENNSVIDEKFLKENGF